MEPEGRRQKDR